MIHKGILVCLLINITLASKEDDHILQNYNCSVEGMAGGTKNTSVSRDFKGTCASMSGCVSPWHYCNNSMCTCGLIPYKTLECNDNNFAVLEYYCATVDQSSCSTQIGICLYNYGDFNNSSHVERYTPLPNTLHDLQDFLCEPYNRTGTLCGRCKNGYYPLAHSFDMNCVECPDGKANWWKYLMVVYLPLTLFYFIVMLFKINVTTTHLYGFVFFCQGLIMPAMARVYLRDVSKFPNLPNTVRYIGSLFSIWNLDIFRLLKLDICLGTNILQTLALDLAVGIYPLLLMMLSYLLIHLYDSNFKPLVVRPLFIEC